jgi:carbon storage regulator
MLCLSRTRGESITIAGGITITVLQASGGKVMLGIDAPKEVLILRSELLQDAEPSAEVVPIDDAH